MLIFGVWGELNGCNGYTGHAVHKFGTNSARATYCGRVPGARRKKPWLIHNVDTEVLPLSSQRIDEVLVIHQRKNRLSPMSKKCENNS